MRELVRQLSRFASVGALATGVHTAIYAGLGGLDAFSPMLANFVAFVFAFGFSYFGHFRVTFKEQLRGRSLVRSYAVQLRFLIVALLGLALNALGVWFVTDYLGSHFLFATLPMVFMVPLVTFFVARSWAFR